MTPTLTETALFTALRTFLLAIVPSGTEVVRGQVNRVPMPSAALFVVMTPLRRIQAAQTVDTFTPAVAPATGTEAIERSTQFVIQLDVYGDGAGDVAQTITTLLRDDYGYQALKPSGIAPLFADDPAQMPLIAGEQQYIERWTFPITLHANVAVSVSTEFADTLITTLVEVT